MQYFDDKLVISYLTLRKTVGFLGFFLPIVLYAGSMAYGGCVEIQSSLSGYYHTVVRDIFVSFLAGISLFLFSYNGYDKRDAIASRVAAVLALVVALFPTSVTLPLLPCNLDYGVIHPVIGKVHLFAALAFFMTLAYFSIFLFTETDGSPTPQKHVRNQLYRTSGVIIVACLILLVGYFVFLPGKYERLEALKPVFWLEVTALYAFSFAWLVKGGLFFKDEEVTQTSKSIA